MDKLKKENLRQREGLNDLRMSNTQLRKQAKVERAARVEVDTVVARQKARIGELSKAVQRMRQSPPSTSSYLATRGDLRATSSKLIQEHKPAAKGKS